MKRFYQCAVAFVLALAIPALAAESDLEQQVHALEQQFAVAKATPGDNTALLQSLKDQVDQLYAQRPENQPRPGGNPLDQGGDLCDNSTRIWVLPYTDSGTTAGYQNNYGPPSPCFGPSNAPDVVYDFYAWTAGNVTVSLCGSSYDTYLYVVEGLCTLNQIACNDDYCDLQSQVTFPVTVGTHYTIFVDGYTTSSGAYTLNVWDDCTIDAQPGDVTECAETTDPIHSVIDCDGGCNNIYNGGAAQYQDITCGQAVYGVGFVYDDGFGIRYPDYDWYRFSVAENCTVRATVNAEFPAWIKIQDYGCQHLIYADTFSFHYCTPLTVSTTNVVLPGTYTLLVQYFSQAVPVVAPPREYRVALECIPAGGGVPAAPESLVVQYTSNALQLNWAPVHADTSGNAITISRYVVYGSADGAAWDSLGVPTPPTATLFNIADLSAPRRFFEVKAVAP